MASANRAFTKDGLIYRPQHFVEDDDDDFLTEESQRDGGSLRAESMFRHHKSIYEDICRVCRSGPSPGRPLFHPCLCTGSIRFIHQECLVQWLKHSGKSHCELCKHEFVFNPIYHPSMPQNLAFSSVIRGILKDMAKNIRHWLHLSLVAFVWLFIMPVCIYRIYRVLFYGSLWSLVRFPLELISLENLASDGFYGLVIVLLSLLGFISVVWLQDQIRNGGGPQWLEQDRMAGEQRPEAAGERDRGIGDANGQQLDQPDFDHRNEDGEEREAEINPIPPPLPPRFGRMLPGLQEKRTHYMKQLQEVQSRRFDQKLEELRVKELELLYDLKLSPMHLMMVLREARLKQTRRMEAWHRRYRVDRYREEVGDEGAVPPESYQVSDPIPRSPPPAGWGEPLTAEELTVTQLYRRDPKKMEEEERTEMERMLEQVQQELWRIIRNQQEHSEMICQVMFYGEKYVFGVSQSEEKKEGEDEEEGEVEGWDADIENAEVGKLLPVESALIQRLRNIKFKITEVSRRQERIAAGLGDDNEILRPPGQDGEERENRRWYDRLLGRPQNEPAAPPVPPPGDHDQPAAPPPPLPPPPPPPLRHRGPARNRPNIGRALVGLARDQPPEPGRPDLAEEITWARLLGLDGTYRFLEHVVWLICLVSVLIISFIFVPYQIGRLAAAALSLWDLLGIVTWRGAAATFIGYVVVCCVVVTFYYGMGWIRLPRVRGILGVMYVAIKVGLILAVEAGIFPLMCGWWIDICAFSLFGSTLSSRQESLKRAPGTVTFLHWLAGMIFIFYLASFVMLLREVLRPGVLWFLRNLNDQNFHPIQEMIGLPMQRHLRRFIMSCLMFGVCVLFALFIPSRIISSIFPSFLPLNLTIASSINPIREIQLELILLQFVVPTLLEHGNSRVGLKFVVRHWATVSSTIFGLQSYLLDKAQTGGDVVDVHENVIRHIPRGGDDQPPDPVAEREDDQQGHNEAPAPDPEGPVYDGPAQVLGPGFAPFKPYLRPHFFYLRMVAFLLFTGAVSVSVSVLAITLPVTVGRLIMELVGVAEAPDIYTAAIGLYAVWLFIRMGSTLLHYLSQGVATLTWQFAVWSLQGLKCMVAGFLLLVVIPLLVGHLVDLVIITPLRVPSNRTPLFYPSTEWALGLLHTKCICGAIWLTNIPFKRTLDQVYQAGVRNLDLTFIFKNVAWPVITTLSLAIALPYIIFMGLVPLTGLPYEHCLLVYRYFFPILSLLLVIYFFITLAVRQSNKLYVKVKNEKYLVGRQLVNYGISPTDMFLEEIEDSEPVQESGEN